MPGPITVIAGMAILATTIVASLGGGGGSLMTTGGGGGGGGCLRFAARKAAKNAPAMPMTTNTRMDHFMCVTPYVPSLAMMTLALSD